MDIVIKNARVHNLKNINLRIPHGKLIVITGLSGSGKSTLAFDTIFAEGQRRYVESLSSYARQFLGKIKKPDVDLIEGIAPAIAVEQKVKTRNSRSTIGTSTEIYDYLRLLYARIGKTYSPISGQEVTSDNIDNIIAYIKSLPAGTKILISAPTKIPEGQSLTEYLTILLSNGFQRLVTSDCEIIKIEEYLSQSEDNTDFSILIDRLAIPENIDNEFSGRIFDSIQKAYSIGEKHVQVWLYDNKLLKEFSMAFEADGIEFEKPHEHMFSFNNPIGACPECNGYGKILGIDEDLVIPDKSKSIYDGAVACWRGDVMGKWKNRIINAGDKSGLYIHKPYYEFSQEERLLLWTGNEYFEGLNSFFMMLQKGRHAIQYRVMLAKYTGKSICPVCKGTRLKEKSLWVKVAGKNIAELQNMSISDLADFFNNLSLDEYSMHVAERIITEIRCRLQYLMDVGLGYLTLGRQSSTLSGGESQRINLASSLGSSLVGSLYILDEPSIGLHSRDSGNLIKVLKKLRDIGNTVIVVEHDKQIIENADWIIDVGPKAGTEGGEIVYAGDINGLESVIDKSLTAQYLFGRLSVNRIRPVRKWIRSITINGARENNLKNITVEIPLGIMTCVTGVSGSGKSSLIDQILYPTLLRQIDETSLIPGDSDGINGDVECISSVELVDQNPIGKSLRSNAVTYLKIYDDIRKLYANQTLARINGIGANQFSFNSPGGRCEECKGEGVIHIEMQFMSDIDIVCDACKGKRFTDDILEIKYHDKNIYDILEMSVDEAYNFFREDYTNKICQNIVTKLSVLQKVGLGYIKLGQSSSTLSGGENQRIKLAYYLLKEKKGTSMFIFDEPTTGLHFHDIEKLLQALDQLVERGHTVIVVEHNIDVIKSSDWIIDLGPEGGENGGHVIFTGTPQELGKCKQSITGKYLS